MPHVFFTASAQSAREADLSLFTEAVASSDLPGAEIVRDQIPTSWDAALRLLAAALPADQPCVVVLDEMPYLIANDSGFEGTLQKLFDRELSRRPVLLLCIGSDLAMMEALNEYGRPFHLLTAKRLVEAMVPLSTQASRETRYVVADPYLRFWLTFLGPHLAEIERGRGDLVLDRIRSSWISWRGRAVEPVIRESLRRLPSGILPDESNVIGGYWTRVNDPEIDIVGADRGPVAKRITVVGSIKWLETCAFDASDLARLSVHRSRLPGTDEQTPLLAVSRAGTTVQGTLVLGPEDLIAAWQSSVTA